MGHARPATIQDAVAIIPKLREADRNEIRAVFGVTPEAVLLNPRNAWTMVAADGELVGMFGVEPYQPDPSVGQVWMVATTALKSHQIEFLRTARVWIEKLHETYPVLGNFVDARNTLHIKWLRWMGFVFINRFEEWGFEQRPFLQFVRLRNPCVPPL